MPDKVSILMLTHDAPKYVEITIRSLVNYTRNVQYELIVVDNASRPETKELIQRLSKEGLISKVRFLDHNSLFAGGNNIAAQMASSDSTHLLLLNSDIKIRHARWLQNLLETHKHGITSYGICDQPLRVDGYCLLIDKEIYLRHMLDEGHQWYWAVTKLQARVLSEGHSVQGFARHEKFLHHFGGKSGPDFKSAAGMSVPHEEIVSWFGGRTIKVLDARPDGSVPQAGATTRAFSRLRRLFT